MKHRPPETTQWLHGSGGNFIDGVPTKRKKKALNWCLAPASFLTCQLQFPSLKTD
jgi:hypothetical protein